MIFHLSFFLTLFSFSLLRAFASRPVLRSSFPDYAQAIYRQYAGRKFYCMAKLDMLGQMFAITHQAILREQGAGTDDGGCLSERLSSSVDICYSTACEFEADCGVSTSSLAGISVAENLKSQLLLAPFLNVLTKSIKPNSSLGHVNGRKEVFEIEAADDKAVQMPAFIRGVLEDVGNTYVLVQHVLLSSLDGCSVEMLQRFDALLENTLNKILLLLEHHNFDNSIIVDILKRGVENFSYFKMWARHWVMLQFVVRQRHEYRAKHSVDKRIVALIDDHFFSKRPLKVYIQRKRNPIETVSDHQLKASRTISFDFFEKRFATLWTFPYDSLLSFSRNFNVFLTPFTMLGKISKAILNDFVSVHEQMSISRHVEAVTLNIMSSLGTQDLIRFQGNVTQRPTRGFPEIRPPLSSLAQEYDYYCNHLKARLVMQDFFAILHASVDYHLHSAAAMFHLPEHVELNRENRLGDYINLMTMKLLGIIQSGLQNTQKQVSSLKELIVKLHSINHRYLDVTWKDQLCTTINELFQ